MSKHFTLSYCFILVQYVNVYTHPLLILNPRYLRTLVVSIV